MPNIKTIKVELSAGDSCIKNGNRYQVINPSNPTLKKCETVLTAEYVIKACEQYFHISNIFDHLYDKSYAKYREICFYFLRKYTALTTMAIGQLFDKHYSTVIIMCQRAEESKKYNPEIAEHINNLIEFIETDPNKIKFRISC